MSQNYLHISFFFRTFAPNLQKEAFYDRFTVEYKHIS